MVALRASFSGTRPHRARATSPCERETREGREPARHRGARFSLRVPNDAAPTPTNLAPAHPEIDARGSSPVTSEGADALAQNASIAPSRVELVSSTEPSSPDPALDAWLEWGSRVPLARVTPIDPAHSDLENAPDRVLVARLGDARLTVDTAPILDGAGEYTQPHELVVLDTDPARRRVRVAVRGDIDLFLWLDAHDLLPTPTRAARLRPTSGRSPGRGAGVWIAPGHVLRPSELENTRVLLVIENLATPVWLSASAIGHVYRRAPFVVPAQNRHVLLPGPVLASPGGATLAHYDDEHLDDFRHLRLDGAWRLVEVVDYGGELRVRGYVPARRVQRVEPWEVGHFLAAPYGDAYRIEPPPARGYRRLEPGTALTTDDGDLVAFVHGYRSVDVPDCGHETVALETAWGAVTLRVAGRSEGAPTVRTTPG